MSTGLIASRYAVALLKYVKETGSGKDVYAQVEKISAALDCSDEFRHIVEAPVAESADSKIAAFSAAVDGGKLVPELEKFLLLLMQKGRMPYIRFILRSFQEKWLEESHIRLVHLTCASPLDGLEDKIRAIVKDKTGDDAVIRTTIDPELIGGFIFQTGDLMLDASIRSQLDAIKRQFTEKNRRII